MRIPACNVSDRDLASIFHMWPGGRRRFEDPGGSRTSHVTGAVKNKASVRLDFEDADVVRVSSLTESNTYGRLSVPPPDVGLLDFAFPP